jgi:hypothetical protein
MSVPITRLRSALALTVALTVLAVPSAAAQVPPGGLPARVAVFQPPVSTVTYPSIDYGKKDGPKDDRNATTTWRVVQETGNCCENYLTVNSAGRLLDFGGTYVNFSDDRGLTWRQVQPLTPLVNGEGAIVAAPGGDVLGIGWDPYSGDHLQAYKFEADTQQWLYTEMPLHQPFYDREWLSVLPGPVTIDGQSYEYVSFVKGGFPYKEVWLYSTDGLSYADITSKAAEDILNGATTQGRLPTAARALNDWDQANTNGHMTQLGGGDLLSSGDLFTDWAILDGDTFSWSTYTLPDGSSPAGTFQVDSAGRVHNVIPASDGNSFAYRISTDGGATWRSTTVTLPSLNTIEQIDFRANKAAGVAAVAIHAQNQGTGTDQDLAYKIGIATDTPFLKRAYRIGLGDINSQAGVDNDIRMDFQTVAVFADGRIATSFIDSTTNEQPAIAVELDTTIQDRRTGGGTVTPVLGTPYASYTFDLSDEGWTTGGTGLWTRQQPGTKTGADDPVGSSWTFWGPFYGNMMSATVTSPAITTASGLAVIQFWLKLDSEPSFDYLYVEWSANGTNWVPAGSWSGRNAAYPNWDKTTVGFTSPGGPVQVRFRFESDQFCSGLEPATCTTTYNGARVDEVIVGAQAP